MFSLSRTVRAIFVCVVHTVYCIMCVVCGALCVVMLDSHQWNTTPGSWRWYESVSSAAWKLPPTLAPSLCAVLLVSPLGPYPDTQRPDHNQRHTLLCLVDAFIRQTCFTVQVNQDIPAYTWAALEKHPDLRETWSSAHRSTHSGSLSVRTCTQTPLSQLWPHWLHADSTPSPRRVHADHIPQWAK